MRTFVLLALTAGLCLSQPPDLKTISGHARSLQGQVKTNIIKAAEKMPPEEYSFRPTPDIRSYADLIAHVADANYLFCSAALGEKNPGPGVEESVKKDPTKAKAALVEALTTSFTYCDKAYAALTDQNASDPVKFFGQDRARIGVLSFNTSHDFEHYGNIVTYLRLKKIVPPSSERRAN
jgi:uncharacterized damage-inducible protein DinB